MLSDETLWSAYTRATYPFGFEAATDRATIAAGLRAVEAAVRADQIERDAAIAENAPGSDATGYYASESHSGYREAQGHIERAIRARLGGE